MNTQGKVRKRYLARKQSLGAKYYDKAEMLELKRKLLNPMEENVGYDIKIPHRRIESLFGTAYPRLELSKLQKQRFVKGWVLSAVLQKQCDVRHLSVDYSYNYENSTSSSTLVSFTLSSDTPSAYALAVTLEKELYAIPRLRTLSPPRFWYRIFNGSQPRDIFLIDNLDFGEVVTWLRQNVSHRDYKIFSKFDVDYTLGFRNPEHATMFKLTFGEQTL